VLSNTDPVAEARAFGLTEDEIEYLRKPQKAVDFANQYHLSDKALQQLITTGQLRSVICRDVLWVQDTPIAHTANPVSPSNFFDSLWQGHFGLAMTYWVYGVLGGLVWAVLLLSLGIEPGSSIGQVLMFVMIGYYVVVYIGIWNAATNYRGNKLWAVLAKFVVAITVLPMIIGFLK
jgi:hypothetical protein